MIKLRYFELSDCPTIRGGSAFCYLITQIWITKLRYLGAVLQDRNPFRNRLEPLYLGTLRAFLYICYEITKYKLDYRNKKLKNQLFHFCSKGLEKRNFVI